MGRWRGREAAVTFDFLESPLHRYAVPLPTKWGGKTRGLLRLLLGDPAVHPGVEQVERQGAVDQEGIVEGADVEAVA